MTVLGIAGSLRSGSLNRELLRRALAAAPEGVEVETWDGLRDVPPFDQDVEDLEPEAVASLREAVAAADAVLIVTPEYNGSIPGVLKNAIDWASRPNVLTGCFRNKPVAVISASDGMFGAMWAGAELKKVMGLVGARVVDAELALPKAHLRLAEPDPELDEAVRDVVARLVAEVQPAAVTRAAA
jgi:chromate reductase